MKNTSIFLIVFLLNNNFYAAPHIYLLYRLSSLQFLL